MPKFLIVDDDPMVARAMQRAAEVWLPEGWDIETVSSPLDGLCMTVTDKEIELVLLDLTMPDVRGDVVAVYILRYRPELRGKIILSSGLDYAAHEAEYLFDELGLLRLDKPLDIDRYEALVLGAITR